MNVVEVRNGVKYYGRRADCVTALDHINITVKYKNIYGLLGPSGCGKTTLLNCIVGLTKLNDGQIGVFGEAPQRKVNFPGPRVGYMPQEISLIHNFSIKEMVFYYGKVFGMQSERIQEQLHFFLDFFNLPDKNQFIEDCSGGEQRIVSFIISVFHEPELILLDEPTVGMDPILREKMWNFLQDIVANSKSAVIITTHYTEEARRTDIVGFMRNGYLLAQNSVSIILDSLGVDSLEEVFIHLCNSQDNQKVSSGNEILYTNEEVNNEFNDNSNGKKNWSNVISNILTLNSKTFLQLYRNKLFFVYTFCFYIILMAITYNSADKVCDYKLGIVNNEDLSGEKCSNISRNRELNFTCSLNMLSCLLIDMLPTDVFIKIYYDTIESAEWDMRESHIKSFLVFPQNFSESIKDVYFNLSQSSINSIKNSQHNLYMNKFLKMEWYGVAKRILKIKDSFSKKIYKLCKFKKIRKLFPINIEFLYQDYTEEIMAIPGMIFSMIFVFSTFQACILFLMDKLDNIHNRNSVGGITITEIITSQTFINCLIGIMQLSQIIFIFRFFYNYNEYSNYPYLILLFVLQYLSGMAFGTLLAVICNSYRSSMLSTNALLLNLIFLSGGISPIEGQPYLMQKITGILPFARPIIAGRHIMLKGAKGPTVYMVYIELLIYIIILYSLSIVILKLRK